MRAVRPLANINAEIAQIEAQRAGMPIQSVNADGVSVVNPLWDDLGKRLALLYDEQAVWGGLASQGSTGNPVNRRWERVRVAGIGTI